jgi:hypothetical protein
MLDAANPMPVAQAIAAVDWDASPIGRPGRWSAGLTTLFRTIGKASPASDEAKMKPAPMSKAATALAS